MCYFLRVFGWILDIFENFFILTEKQRTKPKNSIFLKNFASFDTLIVTESAKVVEIEIISKIVSLAMILRSNIPMWVFYFHSQRISYRWQHFAAMTSKCKL